MWGVTLPYLWRALRRSKVAVVTVVVSAFIAGTIATVKSLIESRIISAVADVVAGDVTGSIWSRPLGNVGSGDSDWVVDVANRAFSGLQFRWGIAIYVAISLLAAILLVATTNAREGISRRLFSDLFQAGVQRAFSGSSVRLDIEDEPGGMAGAVQQGARAVSSAYALWVEAGQYVFSLATVFFVLANVHIGFAAVCFVLVLVLALVSWVQARRLNSRRELYDDRRRSLFAFTDDVLANRDVLLAHERKLKYVDELGKSSDELGSIDKDLSTRESGYLGSVNVIEDLGRIAILGIVLIAAVRGIGVNQVGDAYFYVSLFARIMSPVRGLLSGYDSVRRSMSTSKTLLELLSEQTIASQSAISQTVPTAARAAEFSQVCFGYSTDKVVLKGCSFQVPLGGVTLIVGRSGAGKTTIARMLLGFLRADAGEVSVLGRPMSTWDQEKLLQQMSYLSQTGHVIDKTVRENLFAPENAAESLLTSALMTARLADTEPEARKMLDKRAKTLSEGQKQRLALARIFVDKAPLVILDEPLAGVDAFTFAEVREPMASWLAEPSRTAVMVSHRLEFAAAATHVVVLCEDGSVTEEGAPDDLKAKGGEFAKLLGAGRT